MIAIIPTYNNASTLADVIRRTYSHLPHIMVVNDGSTDNTTSILEHLDIPIELVSYPINRGKGYALKQGFRRAKELGYQYALTLDADGQHLPEEIPHLIEMHEIHPEALILGSRWPDKRRQKTRYGTTAEFRQMMANVPSKNTFANRFSNFWFYLQTFYHLPDTQSGMRVYPLDKLPNLNVLTHRYEAELLLLVLSAWREVEIIPTPIRVYYPPLEERVSHFRPAYDFTRISILNTILCVLALFYGLPRRYYRSLYYCIRFAMRGIFYYIPTALLSTLFHRDKVSFRHWVHRMCLWQSTHIPDCRFIVKGEKISNEPAIIIANHNSILDITSVIGVHAKTIVLAQDWVEHNPFFGAITRYADYYSVSKGIENILPLLRERVAEGYSVLVFPEATRSYDGKVATFHRGAFFLAEELGLPIQPLVLHGTYTVFNKLYPLHIGKSDIVVDVKPAYAIDDTTCGSNYRERTRFFHKKYQEWVREIL